MKSLGADQSGHGPPLLDEISQTISELRELISHLPVASALSSIALRTFLINVDASGELLAILVEYVTWLYLCDYKSAPESLTLENVAPEEGIERVRELSKKTIFAVEKYYKDKRSGGGRFGDNAEDILEFTRVANLFTRGEAFPQHLSAQLHSLLDPFEIELGELLGFNIGQALQSYYGLEKLVNDRARNFIAVLVKESRVDLPNMHQKWSSERRKLSDQFISRVCKELRPVAHRIFPSH